MKKLKALFTVMLLFIVCGEVLASPHHTKTLSEKHDSSKLKNLSQKTIMTANKKYDSHFTKYARTYLKGDNELLKAVCVVESGLKPGARSKADAKGLCQLKPATYAYLNKELHLTGDIYNPVNSIHMSAFYLSKLITILTNSKVENGSIKRLALASYNSGIGNILSAKKKANSNTYTGITNVLYKVTCKRNANTTKQYVNDVLTLAKN